MKHNKSNSCENNEEHTQVYIKQPGTFVEHNFRQFRPIERNENLFSKEKEIDITYTEEEPLYLEPKPSKLSTVFIIALAIAYMLIIVYRLYFT